MDRRDTKSLLRDYAVPMQDNTAYSLSYKKDSSKDPRKAGPKEPKVTKPGKNVKSKPWLKDHTGLLKIKEAKPMAIGGIIHNQDEKHPTKVKSIPMVCPNCGKEDCPGCIPIIPTKGEVPKNLKQRFDYVHRTDPFVVSKLPKRLLYTTPDGIKVFAVSDDFIKINMYDDFTEGGNWEAYPEFVPKGEVWVADDKNAENTKDIITHELTEVRLMQMDGMTYDKAHVIANRIEMKQRVQDNPGLLVRVPKEKKGGKVGSTENKNKPGGSNAGKYSKSDGPFAGPSGGAPTGSYPIGSKSRGKSALKLAHNAPNPSGIKSAVYRKYPDLKKDTKKTMEGAKLGLGGMGQMQDKAPSPSKPKHTFPPDKVKQNFALYKRKTKIPKSAYGH